MRSTTPFVAVLALLLGGVGACAPNTATQDPVPSPSAGNPAGAAAQPSTTADTRVLRGVNVYDLPWYGGYHQSFDAEPQTSYDFLARHGIKLVRLPLPWANLEPVLGGPFDQAFVKVLTDQVRRAANAGMSVILDLHNGCQYPQFEAPQGDPTQIACGRGITEQELDSTWVRLSRIFKDDQAVIGYDIMNEPHDIAVGIWEQYSQSVVSALRDAGDGKLLWIEGANWSQAEDWQRYQPIPWIHDPANNFMYSAHQYFVQYSNYPQGYDFGAYTAFHPTVLSGLQTFIDWLARYDQRGSIGEIGWPNSKETATWRQWNELGEKWYELADQAKLWVTYFSATSVYDEPQDAYDAPRNNDGCHAHATSGPSCRAPGISVAESQAPVIEAHPSS